MSIKQNGGVFGRNPTFNDVTIEGELTFDGDIDINSDIDLPDGKAIRLGNSQDFQIYHDGNNSIIQDSGSGNLRILVGDLQVRNYGTNENIITSTNNAEVALYHNAALKLSTTSSGISVTGGNSGTNVDVASFTSANGALNIRCSDLSAANPTWTLRTFSGEPIAFAQGTTERARITSDGALLVGTVNNSPVGNNVAGGIALLSNGSAQYSREGGTALLVNRKGSAGELVRWNKDATAVGSISVTSSSTAYNTSSDYRLKENVVPMTGSIDRVKALKPSRFNFIADADNTVDGFLAHEAGEVVPECVSGTKDAIRDEEYEVTAAVEEVRDEDDNITTEAVQAVMGTRSVPDMQGIDQSKLVPLLVAALQEAIARIETLEG